MASEAYALRGYIRARQGQVEEAERDHWEALRILRERGLQSALARKHREVGRFYRERGDAERARAFASLGGREEQRR
jgi:hypothetical protein